MKLDAILARLGDSFTVGATPGAGVFRILSPGEALSYLTQAEVDAASRPMLLATVPPDDATAEGDTLTFHGVDYTVGKVVERRLGSTLVARELALVA